MSIKIMAIVWESANVEGATLLVLLALADYANDTGVCWPSRDALAQKSRVSSRHVKRILRDLEDRGLIETDVNGGPRGVNVYTVKPRGDTVSGDIASADAPGRHGDNGYPRGVDTMSPKPSLEPSLGTGRGLSVPVPVLRERT